jgi:hypothetical protein
VQWNIIIETAVETLKDLKPLAGIAGYAGSMYTWFAGLFKNSNRKEAQELWEKFKKEPEKYKAELKQMALELQPNGDPMLEGYVLGLTKERIKKNSVEVYNILKSDKYTEAQVEDICYNLETPPTGLPRIHTKQDAARWAVEKAKTTEANWDTLLKAMVEKNPEVLPYIINKTNSTT